ncbi:MAG: B12-binding domain-containing radical SAM protein [Nanoarchaeota archaeon]|nr:B12-binding domain-containing radical SAM protein [Nanoarchaeota archaeon]
MKVLLTTPLVKHPVKRIGAAGEVGIPAGLLYLAAYVREHNPKIEVNIQTNRLNQYKGIERNMERDFANYDVIATGACTSEYPDALLMLRKAKEKGKITVMGGIFPTTNAEFVLNSGVVDYVIRGEGEATFLELVRKISEEVETRDIEGLSFMKEGQILHNSDRELIEDIDSIPIPAYDLVDMKTYAQITTGPIYSARGCAKSCKFCTLNEHWKYRYRARSIQNVVAEIELLRDYGFKRIHFKDEILTVDRKRAIELFKRLQEYGLQFKGKSRIDTIDEELLGVMCNGGLDTLQFGIENISQKALNSMRKGIKSTDIKRTVEMVRAYCNINPVFLFGWGGETQDTLLENSAYIEEVGIKERVIPYISFMTPHPGSQQVANPELEILTHDFNYYTHKLPIAVPRSLGSQGLRMMIAYFNYLSSITGTAHLNPPIQEDYIERVEGGNKQWKLKSRQDAQTMA